MTKKINTKASKTCILVIKKRDGKLMMAGDRRCSWSWRYQRECPEPKIVKKNGFLLGGTGDSDFLEMILDDEAGFEPDQEGASLKTYLMHKFKNDLSKFLRKHGYRDEHDLLRLPVGLWCQILIGKEGKLFCVSFIPGDNLEVMVEPSLITIGQCPLPFGVGCGSHSAVPILLAKYKEIGYNTKEHLTLAMNTAADISPGCDDKIDYISE